LLLAFPTGASAHTWPDDADEAWRSIPGVDECAAGDEGGLGPRPWNASPAGSEGGVETGSGEKLPRSTQVRGLPPPLAWHRSLVAEDEVPRGELSIRSPRGEARLAVGASALRRGLLLGRYDRCDNSGVPVLQDPYVSRIHVLVAEIDGQVYAIDTGSKNGLFRDHQALRHAALHAGDVVDIAGGCADLAWHSLN
jgi:hypothetical protein